MINRVDSLGFKPWVNPFNINSILKYFMLQEKAGKHGTWNRGRFQGSKLIEQTLTRWLPLTKEELL